MQTTVFSLADGRVKFQQSRVPSWSGLDEHGGTSAVVYRLPNATGNLHRIPAGTSVPIHTGPEHGFCQIVTGRGTLVLPSGEEIQYHGPELFIFEPGTLHGWKDVVEDTLLLVCQVKAPADSPDA
jgi:quercetin dioxygenase-like cupin family protein